MPALDGNRIIADGTYTVATIPGQAYVFSASGDFGSGSLAIRWNDGTNATAFAQSPATSAETWTITAPTRQVDLVLTGSTDPDIRISLAPVDAGSVTPTAVNLAIAADPAATGAALDGATFPNATIQLADTSALTLPNGTLGGDGGGGAVLHDGLTEGGIPITTGTRRQGSWTGSVESAIGASTGLLCEFPIPAAKATAGTVVRVRGRVVARPSGATPTGACVGISTIKQRVLTSGAVTPAVLTRFNIPAGDSATPKVMEIDARFTLTASGSYAGFVDFIADTDYQPEVISNYVTAGSPILTGNNAAVSTFAAIEEDVAESVRVYFSTTSAGTGTCHLWYDLTFIVE